MVCMTVAEVSSARRIRRESLAFTSIGHFLNDGGSFLVPLIVALFVSQRYASKETLAFEPVVYYGASLGFSLLVAYIANDPKRQGSMISFGLILTSIGIIGFGLTYQFHTSGYVNTIFLVSAFVAGIGTSFYHPIGAAILQSTFNGSSKGRALGINGSFGGLGRAIYPSIVFLLAGIFTESTSLIIIAIVASCFSLIIPLGMKSRSKLAPPKELGKKASFNENGEISRTLIILTVVALFTSFATQGIGAWLPTFLSVQKGLGTSSLLGFELSGMYAGSILGQFSFGSLSDRIDKRAVVAIATVGSAASVLAYIFSTGIFDLIFLALIGFFTYTNFPVFLSLASDYIPSKSSTVANALVWNFGVNGGTVIGPAVVSILVFSVGLGWNTAYEIMIGAAFLATLTIPLLRKPTKGDTGLVAA